jgi:hypothetical protein
MNADRLTTEEVMGWNVKRDPRYVEVREKIDAIMKPFFETVFVPELRPRIVRSTAPGMSGKFGETKVCSYRLQGWITLTFSRGETNVTIACREEGEPTSGLASIDASLDEVAAMVSEVTQDWTTSRVAVRGRFKTDRKVIIV